MDEQAKEEMKREKRRIQEQLRRIRRNEEKERLGLTGPIKSQKDLINAKKKLKTKPDLKLKCGACGETGHMRTNKSCPKFIEDEQQLLLQQQQLQQQQKLQQQLSEMAAASQMQQLHQLQQQQLQQQLQVQQQQQQQLLLQQQQMLLQQSAASGLGGDDEEAAPTAKDQLQEIDESGQLVNVEGTKVRVSSKVMKHMQELDREAMTLKISKRQLREAAEVSSMQAGGGGGAGVLGPGFASGGASGIGKKRTKVGSADHCDYLESKAYRTIKRRRTDPLITLASLLEKVHAELRMMDESLQFLQPVNIKRVPDYLEKVSRPMDLQTVRERIQQKQYHSREEFLADMVQIVENSAIYNGEDDYYTAQARKLLDVVVARFQENEDRLIRLEKLINPLLDDDDQVALSYILGMLLNDQIKTMQEAWPFIRPVNKKQMRHYYEVIKDPMDLETLGKNVAKQVYRDRAGFLADLSLIYHNSVQFNGPESEYTLKAKKLVDVASEALDSYKDYLDQIEAKISAKYSGLTSKPDQEAGPSTGHSSSSVSDNRSGTGGDIPVRRPVRAAAAAAAAVRKASSTLDTDEFEEEDEDDDEDDEDDDEDEDWVGHHAGPAIDPEHQQQQPFYQQDEDMVVDENYDPTDFLHSLGKPRAAEDGEQVQQQQPMVVVDTMNMDMQNAVVEGTIEVPANVQHGDMVVINALPAVNHPEEDSAPINYTFVPSSAGSSMPVAEDDGLARQGGQPDADNNEPVISGDQVDDRAKEQPTLPGTDESVGTDAAGGGPLKNSIIDDLDISDDSDDDEGDDGGDETDAAVAPAAAAGDIFGSETTGTQPPAEPGQGQVQEAPPLPPPPSANDKPQSGGQQQVEAEQPEQADPADDDGIWF